MLRVFRLLPLLLLLAACSNPPTAGRVEREVVLAIDGMHCEGCVASIGDTLRTLEGVVEAKVSLDEKRALVKLAHGGPNDETLIAAVDHLGYHARILDPSATSTAAPPK